MDKTSPRPGSTPYLWGSLFTGPFVVTATAASGDEGGGGQDRVDLPPHDLLPRR